MSDHDPAGSRPWPRPSRPWVMAQAWHDLLFAHWPIAPETLRGKLPRTLELDTFHGTAWLGVVPFRMSGVRLRGTAPLPWLSAFPELNVRMYVRYGERTGVWFLSLDAARWLAVAIARAWFRLPYFRAQMSCTRDGEDVVYASVRTHAGAPRAELAVRYGPRGDVFLPRPGTLEHWLTERYGLYALSRRGEALFAEIDHPPWPLQPAAAIFEKNTMAGAHGIELPASAPFLHFVRRQDVVVWGPQRATSPQAT
ncbi:MAG: YqjF family protein [Candidatus Rokuibacteriota bacterium]